MACSSSWCKPKRGGRRSAAVGEALRVAHNRYTNGYASYLEELGAQRTAFSADLAALQLRTSLLAAAQALGQLDGAPERFGPLLDAFDGFVAQQAAYVRACAAAPIEAAEPVVCNLTNRSRTV